MVARRVLGLGLLGSLMAACSPARMFNEVALIKTRSRVIRGVDYRPGARGKLDIYAPPGDSSTPRPVVVFIYGGGWDSGERGLYSFVGASLASLGYVTVIPDYRVFPEVRFPSFLQDNADAVRWVRDHIGEHGGDVNRMALMGHSAGAYNAMMLALDRQWLTTTGVDPSIIKAVCGLAGPYDFYPFTVQSSQQAFGSWPDPIVTQPVHFVRKDAPPVWVANGLQDDTVRPYNARNLVAALHEVGAVAQERYYSGINHVDIVTAMSFPFEGKAPVRKDVGAFLKAHIG